MKRCFLVVILLFPICVKTLYSQDYNSERTALAKFLTRMYTSSPFEGVRVVNDYDNNYLISVLSLDPAKYKNNMSVMNRVAGVKAMSQASVFFNGSQITSELVIKTSEIEKESCTEILETINENSVGFVKALEQLTNFENNGRIIFIYVTPVNQ